MENFQVFIPKPCTENWNQMTPQESGRFCDKCAKTVVDFSNKSPGEIKDYFFANTGNNVCGRFRNDQLNQPITIQLYFQSSTNRNPLQIFYLSCLLVFGTTLFSCTNEKDQVVNKIELSSENASGEVNDSMHHDTSGLFLTKTNVSKCQTIGKISSVEAYDDTNAIDTTINLPAVDIESDRQRYIGTMMGAISWVHIEKIDPLDIDTSGVIHRTENEESFESISTDKFEVFPNPANEYVNVKIVLPGQTNVKVDLFDLNGKLIRTIIPNEQIDGAFDQQINIQDLEPATYLLRLVKGDKVETKRLIVM